MTERAAEIKSEINRLKAELLLSSPAAELSIRELAKVVGISPATAHRFKAGKAVDIPTARKLMSAGVIKECPCCGRKALSGGEDGR